MRERERAFCRGKEQGKLYKERKKKMTTKNLERDGCGPAKKAP